MQDPAFDASMDHLFNGRALRDLLRACSLSFEDIQDKLGSPEFNTPVFKAHYRTIRKWGKETEKAPGAAIIRLAEVFEVSPWTFVTNERVDHKRYISKVDGFNECLELAESFSRGRPISLKRVSEISRYGKLPESAKPGCFIIQFAFVVLNQAGGNRQILVINRSAPHIITTGNSILQSFSPSTIPRSLDELETEYHFEVALPRSVEESPHPELSLRHLGCVRNEVKDRTYYFWVFAAEISGCSEPPRLPVDPNDVARWCPLEAALAETLTSAKGEPNRVDRLLLDLLSVPGLARVKFKEATVVPVRPDAASPCFGEDS